MAAPADPIPAASHEPSTSASASAYAPASPPPPSAPIAATPGPRAARLADLYANSITHVLRACSYSHFAACFPTPAARRPAALRSVWQQVVGKVEAKANEEFEAIAHERDVVRGLNQLEALVGEAKRRREGAGGDTKAPVPPHTLPPDDIFGAHLAPQLAPVHAELQAQLRATRARNEELATDLARRRADIEALVGGLEAVVADLEGANRALDDALEDGSVRSEIREMVAEVEAMEGVRHH